MNESISVSLLNKHAKFLIESDEVLSQVWVEGEISGFSVHQKTGHAYFTLRDSEASVKAVMFCQYASQLRFLPKDGMYVVADCRVSFYERDGLFQLNIYDLMPKGAGAIQKLVDEVKNKLATEGLFAPERKRGLPKWPHNIGVITSASSAALQDILSVIERRNPTVKVTVFSTSVQGADAVESMILAVGLCNRNPAIDLVIMARGGGSKEDLWYFNDEKLVRAAATLRVPLISAVGHETDTMLIDFVSDARAPTPSAAAELAVCDIAEELRHAATACTLLRQRLFERLDIFEAMLCDMREDLKTVLNDALVERQNRVDELETLCRALDPKRILLRGYSKARRGSESISCIGQLAVGDRVELEFADGTAGCLIDTISEGYEYG